MSARHCSFVWMLTLMLAARGLAAQDSVKALILSPRVGTVLTAEDCGQYNFFTSIPSLESVTFLRIGSSMYAACISYRDEAQTLRDSLIPYSLTIIRTYGERIEHFEEIRDGTYHIGTDTPQLVEVPYERSLPVWTHDGTVPDPRGKAAQEQRIRDFLRTLPGYDHLPLDTKAFSDDDAEYPIIGIGAGYSYYVPDFSGLQSAFTAIEDVYRREGNTIPRLGPEFGEQHLRCLTFLWRFSPRLSLVMEGGNSKDGEVTMLNGAMMYSTALDSRGKLRLSGGIGLVHMNVDANRPYNAGLPSKGEYCSLDDINVKCAGTGLLLRGAVTLTFGTDAAIEVYGEYFGIRDIAIAPERFQSAYMRFRAPVIGVTLMLLFY